MKHQTEVERLREEVANLETQLEFQRRENDELRRLIGHKHKAQHHKNHRAARDLGAREVTLDPETYGVLASTKRWGRASLEQVDSDPEGKGNGFRGD